MTSAALQQAPASEVYSDAFWRALASLTTRGVSEAQAGHALAFWQSLSPYRPKEPHIHLVQGCVQFGWSDEAHVLTIGIDPEGRFDWWHLDRRTNVAEGTEDVIDEALPPAAWTVVAHFARP